MRLKFLLCVAAIAAIPLAPAHARNSDWSSLLFGASSRLTCEQFNKLGKAEKDGALSWALGYISGMATSAIEDARMHGKSVDDHLDGDIKASDYIAEIKRRCLEQPDATFPLAVEWTYVEPPAARDVNVPIPLPRPRPKEAPQPRAKTVLFDERGGDYWLHWRRFKALADGDDDVEIRTKCPSSCTLVMVLVPADRLCFGKNASLQFHMARNGKTGEPDMEFTKKWMIDQYPQDIRNWILAKGGVEKMNVQQMLTLDAAELWKMGYRECGPESEPPAVPMTRIAPRPPAVPATSDALKHCRPTWPTAAEQEEREREASRKWERGVKELREFNETAGKQ
jgi:hypothetical protein